MTAAIAWPAATLIALVFLVLVFRTQITAFLENLESIGGDRGARRFPREQKIHTQESAPDPAANPLLPAPADASQSAPTRVAGQSISVAALFANTVTRATLEKEASLNTELPLLDDQSKREAVLVRLLASAYVIRDFNWTYYLIFGSQIGALAALNSAGDDGVATETLRTFYENAVAQAAGAYADYRFEQWLEFLVGHGLIQVSSNGYAITSWGNEFLIHLARSKRLIYKTL